MISAMKKKYPRSMCFAKNLIVLLTLFIFTTFTTDKNIGYIPVTLSDRVTEAMPVDFLGQSLEGLIRHYDDYIGSSVAENASPGAAVAIAYNGEIRLLKGYGVKKEGSADPVDIHTAFRIGSVSKGFAGVLTGIMARENMVSWDDKVAAYLPDFHHYDAATFNKLTLKNILSQSSGFPTHTFTDLLDDNIPYCQILEQLKSVPFCAKPGQVYSYQNVVFSLVDEVLKNTSGKDYAYLLREKILYPLQMKDASSEYVSLIMSGNYASPHLRTRDSWLPIENNPRYYATIPASGINASIADMAQWLLALTGAKPDVIAPDVLEEVFEPVIDIPIKRSIKKAWGNADEFSYALGWRVIRIGDKTIVFHLGHVQGFLAEIGFCPEDQVGIVMLFNSNTHFNNDLLPSFFENLYQYHLWEPFSLDPERI